MKRINKIIVTWDFTEQSKYAFLHAMEFSRKVYASIELLHIVDSQREIPEAEKRLKEDTKTLCEKCKLGLLAVVRAGSIFNTIGKTALERGAFMIVMGTHGVSGMQKILGSKALKVIANSKVPFVTVQSPPKEKNYKSIVYPITKRVENKEKLKWVRFVAGLYRVKVHLVVQHIPNDDTADPCRLNLLFAKKFMKAQDIDYEITNAREEIPFDEEVINYADKIDAKLIMLVIRRDLGFSNFVLGTDEQNIISNSKVPVMCVNANKSLFKIGSFN